MKRVNRTYKSLVVEILSSSFHDNKSINYIVKQDSKRKERIKNLMEYCFDICEVKGEIFISDDKNACAMILHPDRKMGTVREMLLDLKLAMNSIGIFRSLKVMKRERLLNQNHPVELYYYLWFIGVKPEAQGN